MSLCLQMKYSDTARSNTCSVYVFAPKVNSLHMDALRHHPTMILTSPHSKLLYKSRKNEQKHASRINFFAFCLLGCCESHTFASFFMVLDLRLVKIGCRETINFFCFIIPGLASAKFHNKCSNAYSPPLHAHIHRSFC